MQLAAMISFARPNESMSFSLVVYGVVYTYVNTCNGGVFRDESGLVLGSYKPRVPPLTFKRVLYGGKHFW